MKITSEMIEKSTKFFMENGGEIKLYDEQDSIPLYVLNDVTSFGDSIEILDNIEVELFLEEEREDMRIGAEQIFENEMNLFNDLDD